MTNERFDSEEFQARVCELLKKEQSDAYHWMLIIAESLENTAKRVKDCADKFLKDTTNGGKSLHVYVAVDAVEGALHSSIYHLRWRRDKIDALIELKNEEAGE